MAAQVLPATPARCSSLSPIPPGRLDVPVALQFLQPQRLRRRVSADVRRGARCAGNLYGTTWSGGSNFGGVAYELSPGTGGGSWTLKVLHNFCSDTDTGCPEGYLPSAGITYAGAASGALYDGTSPLYGVTTNGGPNKTASVNGGVAYSLTKGGAGHWKLHALYAFCSLANCADGDAPSSGLTVSAAGDLLGVTELGGANNWGTLFLLNPTHGRQPWREKILSISAARIAATSPASPSQRLRWTRRAISWGRPFTAGRALIVRA